MKIPLFDLDGTLLIGGSDNSIHRASYDFALHKVFELPTASFNEIVIDGMLDSQILLEVAMLHGYSKKDAITKLPKALQTMVDYFFQHKKEHLSQAHQGAKELLQTMQPKTHVGVLTGNVEQIAWIKLAQAGLKDYIAFGAFGNMALKRVDLIKVAQERYEEVFDEQRALMDFVIIGDTPKDIACARDGGISVIAVATGKYTKEELKEADLVVESLEEQEKILNFLS